MALPEFRPATHGELHIVEVNTEPLQGSTANIVEAPSGKIPLAKFAHLQSPGSHDPYVPFTDDIQGKDRPKTRFVYEEEEQGLTTDFHAKVVRISDRRAGVIIIAPREEYRHKVERVIRGDRNL